jgi:hypothetical protein
MVNEPLPCTRLWRRHRTSNRKETRRQILRGAPKHHQSPALSAFVQILGKLYFFKLSENLRRILFDYEENRPGTANTPFKGAC